MRQKREPEHEIIEYCPEWISWEGFFHTIPWMSHNTGMHATSVLLNWLILAGLWRKRGIVSHSSRQAFDTISQLPDGQRKSFKWEKNSQTPSTRNNWIPSRPLQPVEASRMLSYIEKSFTRKEKLILCCSSPVVSECCWNSGSRGRNHKPPPPLLGRTTDRYS